MSQSNLRRSPSNASSKADLRRSNSAASHRNLLVEPGEARNSGVVLSGSSLTFYRRTIDSNPDWPGSKNYFHTISAQPAYRNHTVEEIRYIDYCRAGSSRAKYERAHDLAANPPLAFHSISAMGEYLDCCVEEIRFEDYSYFPKINGRDPSSRFYGFDRVATEVPIENIFNSPAREPELEVPPPQEAQSSPRNLPKSSSIARSISLRPPSALDGQDDLGFRAPPPAPALLPSLVEPEPASPPKDANSPPAVKSRSSHFVRKTSDLVQDSNQNSDPEPDKYSNADSEEPTSLLAQLQEMMRQAQQIRKEGNDKKMKHLKETAERFNRALGMGGAQSNKSAKKNIKHADNNATVEQNKDAESAAESESDDDDRKSLRHQTQFPSVLALPDSPSSGTIEDGSGIVDKVEEVKSLPAAIARRNSAFSDSNTSVRQPESIKTFKSELESENTYSSESESATATNVSSSVHSEEEENDIDDIPNPLAAETALKEANATPTHPVAPSLDAVDRNAAPLSVVAKDPFAKSPAASPPAASPVKAVAEAETKSTHGMDVTNEEDEREEDRVEHMKRMDSFLEDAAAVALVTPKDGSTRAISETSATGSRSGPRSDASPSRYSRNSRGANSHTTKSAKSGTSARSRESIIETSNGIHTPTNAASIGDRPRSTFEDNSSKFSLGSSDAASKVKRGMSRSGSRAGILRSASNGNVKRAASNQSIESLSRSQTVYADNKTDSSDGNNNLPHKKTKRAREEDVTHISAASGPLFSAAPFSPAPVAPTLPVENEEAAVNPFSPSVSSPPSTYSNPFTTSTVSEQQPGNMARSLGPLPAPNGATNNNINTSTATSSAPGAGGLAKQQPNSSIFRSSPMSNSVTEPPAFPDAPNDLFKPLGLKKADEKQFSPSAFNGAPSLRTSTPRAKSFTPQSTYTPPQASDELLALQRKHIGNEAAKAHIRPQSLNLKQKSNKTEDNTNMFKSAFALFEQRANQDTTTTTVAAARSVPSSAPPSTEIKKDSTTPAWITQGKFRFKSHENDNAAATGRSVSHDGFPSTRAELKPLTPTTMPTQAGISNESKTAPSSAASSLSVFPAAGVEIKPLAASRSKSRESSPVVKNDAPPAAVAQDKAKNDTETGALDAWHTKVDGGDSSKNDSLFSPLEFSSPLQNKAPLRASIGSSNSGEKKKIDNAAEVRRSQQLDKQKLALPFGTPSSAEKTQTSPTVESKTAPPAVGQKDVVEPKNIATSTTTTDSAKNYSPSPIVKSSDLKNALRSLVKPSPVVVSPEANIPTPPPPPPPMNVRSTADEIDADEASGIAKSREVSFRNAEETTDDADGLALIQKPAPLPPYAAEQPGPEGYDSEFSDNAEFVDCRDVPASSKGKRFWSNSSTNSAKINAPNSVLENERSLIDPPVPDKPLTPQQKLKPVDEYDDDNSELLGSRLSTVSSTIAKRMQAFQSPAAAAETKEANPESNPTPRSVLLPKPPAVRADAPVSKVEVAPPPGYKPPARTVKQGSKTFSGVSGVRPEKNKKSSQSPKKAAIDGGPTPAAAPPKEQVKQLKALAVPISGKPELKTKPTRSNTAPKKVSGRAANAIVAKKVPAATMKGTKKHSVSRKTAAECVAEDKISARTPKEQVNFPVVEDDESFVDVPSTKSFGKLSEKEKRKEKKDENRPLADKYKKRMDGVNALSDQKSNNAKSSGRSKNVSKDYEKRSKSSNKNRHERSRKEDVQRTNKKRPSNKPKVMVLPVRAHSDFNEPKSAYAELGLDKQERAQSDIFKVPKNAAQKKAMLAKQKRAHENISEFSPSKETSSLATLKTAKQSSLARRHSLPSRGSASDLGIKASDLVGHENFSDRSRNRGIKAPNAGKQQRTQTMLASLWGTNQRDESLGNLRARRASTDLDPSRAKAFGAANNNNRASAGINNSSNNMESMDAGAVAMYDDRGGLFSGVRKLFSKVRRKPGQHNNNNMNSERNERMSMVEDDRSLRGSMNRGGFRDSMQRGSTGMRGSIVSGRGSIIGGRRHKSDHKNNRRAGRALFKGS